MIGRNERFVRAAKRLLTFQLVAAAGAAAVTGWAVIEVREVLGERDALAARVKQLEAVLPPELLPPAPVDGPLQLEPVPQPGGTTETADPETKSDPGPTGGGSTNQTSGGGTQDPVEDGDSTPTDNVTTGGDKSDGNGTGPIDIRPVEPQPERNCQSVERRPIVCVPPFRRTPVPGVCVDGNNRPMRCPRREPVRDTTNQQQTPTLSRPPR
jgi:hypothetical protein